LYTRSFSNKLIIYRFNTSHFVVQSPSSETQGQIVGKEDRSNGPNLCEQKFSPVLSASSMPLDLCEDVS